MRQNETIDLMLQRQSCRKFTTQAIDPDIVEAIVTAGQYAPNAGGGQPWTISAVTNKALLEHIGELMEADLRAHMPGFDPAEMVEHHGTRGAILFGADFAPMLLVISEAPGEQTPVVCSCLAAENMILAAESFGLSSCWLGAVTANLIAPALAAPDGDPALKQLVPDGNILVGAIALGYPAQGGFRTPRVPRRTGSVQIFA